MNQLTIGKLRGIQQLSNQSGIISILAEDQRGSMQKLINPDNPDSVTPQDLTIHKLELAEAMAQYATGVLLDPEYGASQAIAAGVLPGSTGLLVSTEVSGYEATGDKRYQVLIEGWDVEKIKRMGASAAKLLIHYRHDTSDVRERQEQLVSQLAERCKELDLAFLVEPVTYALSNESKEEFAEKKPQLVVEAAKTISKLGVDILKLEFPTTHMNYDRTKLRDFCRAVNDATSVPWVILSAGVAFDVFELQTEIACECGASGFACGRAIWQEAMPIHDADKRRYFLNTTARQRLERLNELANRYATPWYRKLGLEPNKLTSTPEDWYKNYNDFNCK